MTISTMTRTVLIVDDEPAVVAALQRALRRRFAGRLLVTGETDPHAALARTRTQHFDIVLSDLRMPQIDGVTLLTLMTALVPNSVRMLLTATADFETAQRAINEAGLFRYLTKPWTDTDLVAHFEAALLLLEAPPLPGSEGPRESELRRLERLEPGLTYVDWGPQGEVLMPPLPGASAKTP